MSCSGQPKQVSVRLRPKILACFCFGFGISILSSFGVLTEIPYFGQINLDRQHISVKKTMAETVSFGQNKVKSVSAEISVSASISAFSKGLVSVSMFRQKNCFG